MMILAIKYCCARDVLRQVKEMRSQRGLRTHRHQQFLVTCSIKDRPRQALMVQQVQQAQTEQCDKQTAMMRTVLFMAEQDIPDSQI